MNHANRAGMVIALVGLAYIGWALNRLSPAIDGAWPRGFPYPDEWLEKICLWLDARNPPPPGSSKLHGEILTVRIALWLVQAGFAGLLVLSLLPALRRWKRQQGGGADD